MVIVKLLENSAVQMKVSINECYVPGWLQHERWRWKRNVKLLRKWIFTVSLLPVGKHGQEYVHNYSL